jgi:hypothetical protein
VSKFDILSSASWLDAGNFYVYGDIQIGKTPALTKVISHLTNNGYCVVYLTQPLNMLRKQTTNDFEDPRNKLTAALHDGVCLGLEKNIAWVMQERIETNRSGLLLCDLMHTAQVGRFIESLQGDIPSRKMIREKLIVIYDEADLYLSEMEQNLENATSNEKSKIINDIAMIERDMNDLNDLVHSTIRVTGSICGPFMSAIKAARRPDHMKIVCIPRENPNYQNLKNFVTTPARAIERTKYTARDDKNIPDFVRSVLSRNDEPVALLQIHRHSVKHADINAEVARIADLEGKLSETAILTINQTTGNQSVADKICNAHKAGKKYIFLVGGAKLERGIRCASSECMTDHRHLTDLYILPPKKPIMATLLQQMRLSGSYATNKPRCLLIPETALAQVQAYFDLQAQFISELQKPLHEQRTLLDMSKDLKYARLVSTRHAKAIQASPTKRLTFSTLDAAVDFAKKQTTAHVPIISEVHEIPRDYDGHRRAKFLKDHNVSRYVTKPEDLIEVRRWVYSSAESVETGDGRLIYAKQTRSAVREKYYIEVNITKGLVCTTYPYVVKFPKDSLNIGDAVKIADDDDFF